MNRMWKTLIPGIAIILTVAAGIIYLQSGKAVAGSHVVGYVDSDSILEAYAPAIAVHNELGQLQKKNEDALREKITAKFGTGDPSLLPKESQMEIQKMIEEAEASYQSQMEDLRNRKWTPIVEQVHSAMEKVAAQEGTDVVLDRSAVLAGGVDLTQNVIDYLGKQQPGAAPTAAPAQPAAPPKK